MFKTLLKHLLFTGCVVTGATAFGQVGINTTGSQPDASAQLDVASSSKGVLMPRMTTAQRNAVTSPATGLLVFDTDKGTFMFFDGANWKALAFADENKIANQNRTSSAPAPNAGFGTRVAVSGNYAVIGAPKYAVGANSNSGAVYVFFKGPSGWKQQAMLTAWDGEANDYFGGAVAISGDYIAVGTNTKKVDGKNNAGKVYLFKRNGATWAGDSSVTKPSRVAYDAFGWCVALSSNATGGPTLMVGAPYSDVGGTDMGEVVAFTRSDAGWKFAQSIVPGDLGANDLFGMNVSMYGDYVVASAPYQDNTTYSFTDAGAAYVYVYGGGVWNQQQKLQGSVAKGQFGQALAIYDNRLAIGAPWATTYTNTSSSVYLYKRTGANWVNTSSLYVYNFEIVPGANQINSNSTSTNKSISIANLTFGMSLALDSANLLIGASSGLDYPNGGSSYYSDNPGSVYFYKRFSGDTYTRVQVVRSDYPQAGDLFGQSVGLSTGNYIIANPRAIVDGNINAGNVSFGAVSQ